MKHKQILDLTDKATIAKVLTIHVRQGSNWFCHCSLACVTKTLVLFCCLKQSASGRSVHQYHDRYVDVATSIIHY